MPGGPEDEEEGQNGKWPEIPGNPVSPIRDGKIEAEREERIFLKSLRERRSQEGPQVPNIQYSGPSTVGTCSPANIWGY